jgi:hypothetical protein
MDPGSLPDQDQALHLMQLMRQCFGVVDVVIEHQDIVSMHSFETVEVSYTILVIVKHRDFHGRLSEKIRWLLSLATFGAYCPLMLALRTTSPHF